MGLLVRLLDLPEDHLREVTTREVLEAIQGEIMVGRVNKVLVAAVHRKDKRKDKTSKRDKPHPKHQPTKDNRETAEPLIRLQMQQKQVHHQVLEVEAQK